MNIARILPLCIIISLGTVFSAHAEGSKIPALENVSQALPDPPRGTLEKQREALAAKKNSLRTRIKWHDEHCQLYDSNSSYAETCPPLSARLPAEKETYIKEVNHFNWDLSQAIGGERNRLEKIISNMDKALQQDAAAVQNLGFKRRAQDFSEWDKLSEDAHRKLWNTLTTAIIDQGAEALRDGILNNLAKVGPEKSIAALEKAGLGSSEAATRLRALPSMADKQAYNEIAKIAYDNIKADISMKAKSEEGQNLETTAELIELLAPDTLKGFFKGEKVGEVAVWAMYDAAAQSVAVNEVAILNKVTDAQLKGLQSIKCVTEKHAITRYDAKIQLGKLTNRDTSDLVKPHQSGNCSA